MWMELKSMLSSQAQRYKYHMFYLCLEAEEVDLTELEHGVMVSNGWEGIGEEGFG